MSKVTVHVVNAFTDGGRGGNPAGLVLDADRLNGAQKQAIAAEAGFSETAFVSRSKVADVKLEFFTPVRQIAHCGHATIATFCTLKSLGRLASERSSKETIDGVRRVFFEGDAAFMEQASPCFFPLGARQNEALAALGLPSAGRPQPEIVNTGNSFLIVPVEDSADVAAVKPDFDAVARLSEALDLIGVYVYAPSLVPGRTATARMFAPRYGIREESATGMAAGPLACFLHERAGLRRIEYLIEQGVLMPAPSPSLLIARLDVRDGRIRSLAVGGRAVISRTFEIRLKDR